MARNHQDKIMRALGYRVFTKQTAPHCESCGPFGSRYLRPVGSDEFGTLWRCEGCDRENGV